MCACVHMCVYVFLSVCRNNTRRSLTRNKPAPVRPRLLFSPNHIARPAETSSEPTPPAHKHTAECARPLTDTRRRRKWSAPWSTPSMYDGCRRSALPAVVATVGGATHSLSPRPSALHAAAPATARTSRIHARSTLSSYARSHLANVRRYTVNMFMYHVCECTHRHTREHAHKHTHAQ